MMTTKLLPNLDTPFGRWSTSSFGSAADTSPRELNALGEHLDLCKLAHGRFFALKCMAEAAHGFLGARFVTSILATGVALAVFAWLF
jgi:hypothetical protein